MLLGSSQAQVCSGQWVPTQGLGCPESSRPPFFTQEWSHHWPGLWTLCRAAVREVTSKAWVPQSSPPKPHTATSWVIRWVGLSLSLGRIMVSKPPYHRLHKHVGRSVAQELAKPLQAMSPVQADRALRTLYKEYHVCDMRHTTQTPLVRAGLPKEDQYYQSSRAEGVRG